MSSTTIPSVAAMNEMFNKRMRAYATAFASREASSRGSTSEAPSKTDNKSPKRKWVDDTSEDEGATEEEEEEEAAETHQENRKIILKINFTSNIILSVNSAPTAQPAQPTEPEASANRAPLGRRPPTPHSQTHRRCRQRHDGDEGRNIPSLRPLRRRPTTNTTATAASKTTNHNLRARRLTPTPSSSPPPFPFLRIENEKKERWDPIPFPCSLLPDDTEGPKAAWARLFPHLAPFGEYGGKPTGWMERMCWKDGEWRARGPEEPYVERFLGRKRGTGTGTMVVEVGWRRG